MRRKVKQLIYSFALRTGGLQARDSIARALSGVGCIFVMHRVVKEKSDSPARGLTITAAFLDQALGFLRDAGAEFISLSSLGQRLASGGPFAKPVVCLTFDDGYRDNLTLALPILRKHNAPATIFTPSGAPDRTMDVWFLRLEKAVMSSDELRPDLPGVPPVLASSTPSQKADAYRLLSQYVHQDIMRNKDQIQSLLPPERISDEALAAEQFLTWRELRELADDPLVTIGGHTVSHPVLRDLDERAALHEMVAGRSRLAAELDRPIDVFSYPYGGRQEIGRRELRLAREAGFDLAVTTYYEQVRPRHGAHAFEIPRMTLGGLREDIGALAFDVLGCIGAGASKDELGNAAAAGRKLSA
jgi:peptidoglycan/xylan/chitin deacetylase (PgdA/CDA1 family)